MKKGLRRLGLVLLLIFIIFALDVYAEKTKLRVVVENASIRIKPELQGEIIKNPPIGSVFESEQKEGAWYEISVRTEVGVLITGYIHEMFVEVLTSEAPPPEPQEKAEQVPEKKTDPVEPPPPPPEPTQTSKAKSKRVDIVFRGGYMTGYSTESSSYSDSFSGGVLENANVSGTITTELKTPWGFDAALNLYIAKGVGIQVRFDYASKSKFTEASKSSFNMDWTWDDGDSFNRQNEWGVNGDVSLSVLSGNLVVKVPTRSIVAPVFSGGISYFSGSAKADTSVGYGNSWVSDGFRYIDYFVIPAMVDASLGGIGFNAGAGIDFAFSPSVALNIEGRYFSRSRVQENWKLQPGKYPSTLHDEWSLTLDQNEVDEIAATISPFYLNPSFFKISAGIKLMF